MNSQVKLVSSLSLEDKAKEYAKINYDVEGDKVLAEIDYQVGYKQAIQDLMERASESPLEFSTTYTGWMDQTDGSRAAYISGETDKRKVIFLKDLEQAAEDLIKEGE